VQGSRLEETYRKVAGSASLPDHGWVTEPDEAALLAGSLKGNEAAFERLVDRYRRELYAHCYRMLGSVQDAEDATQDSLLAAWRSLASFEGRSSLRAWLYRVCTNACLRLRSRRPARVLSMDYGPAFHDTSELGEWVSGPVWLEPLPDARSDFATEEADPAVRYQRRESIELAFIAALQHLPSNQRAVLILRDVLDFSAAETAGILDTSATSVNSLLRRARKNVDARLPATTQQQELVALGDEGQRQLVEAFVTAWERADLDALLELLAEDARFSMPPLPAWFDGREDVARFLAERVFETPWRLRSVHANGQLGFACYVLQPGDNRFRMGAINLLSLRDGKITQISAFLDPSVYPFFGVPVEFS
jgi:RNA polymerase sigma-70 factor (TIGR02960 family)